MTDEKTFQGIDLSAERLPGICPDCSHHGIEHASGLNYVYCEHEKRGLIRQPNEDWFTFEGVTSLKFKQLILETIFSFEVACGEVVSAQIARDGDTMQ